MSDIWPNNYAAGTPEIGVDRSPPAAEAQPAALVQALREKLHDTLAAELGGAYDCTRVWEAWSVGTMSQDDFVPVNERANEIVDVLIHALASAAQPAAPSQAVVVPLSTGRIKELTAEWGLERFPETAEGLIRAIEAELRRSA